MRGDDIIKSQLLMAQAFGALAITVSNSVGVGLTPTVFADLPASAPIGMIACISDSTVIGWGNVVAGGGPYIVVAFFNGTYWTVIGR